MGRLLHLRGDPHEETEKLLPWYVTGQLDRADRMLVDAHLSTCDACRQDLALERRLGAAIGDLPLAIDEPWERFAAGLPPQRDRAGWRRPPARFAWLAGAQAAVILLGIGLFATQRTAPLAHSDHTPAYHALGDAAAATAGNVLVMFAPGTSEQTVRETIEAVHGRRIGNPTDAGAYVVAVAPAERATALAALRARATVTLAQPIDAPDP